MLRFPLVEHHEDGAHEGRFVDLAVRQHLLVADPAQRLAVDGNEHLVHLASLVDLETQRA